jgi:uncharacterized membrane protein required for colicin V production
VADLVMLLFTAGLLRAGWSSGFIRRLLGLVFLAGSFVAGAYLRVPAGAIVGTLLPQIPSAYAEMVGYTVASSALLLGLNLVSQPFMSRAPKHGLSRKADQTLGLVLGGIEAILILSVGIVILHTYADVQSVGGFVDTGLLHDVRVAVDGSTIGQLLEKTTVPIVLLLLGPLLPKDVTTVVQTSIPGGLPFFPKVPVP